MKFRPRISLAACGAVLGTMAVAMDLWGGLYATHAYGFCTTCHGQDLVGWLVSRFVDVNWQMSPVGAQTPLLTGLGVVLGAYLAARSAGERRLRAARQPWLNLLAGILVGNLAVLALGCPIRQVILLGYGDWMALLAILSYGFGAFLGLLILKRRANWL